MINNQATQVLSTVQQEIKQAHAQKVIKEIIQAANHVMTPEEFEQHGRIITRFERAKQIRNAPYKYYDGMDYERDYVTNENNKNTFLTPKLNESEVRINTGTSEKKLDAIKNELLTMNLQHEVRAFDENDYEIVDLGTDFGDLVTRTNQIEKDDDMWEEAIDELLSQRVVYIREIFERKTLKGGKVQISMARKELLSGLQVFPGDWTIPAYLWDTQPYICLYDRMSYDKALSLFGHYKNFQHVRPNATQRKEYLTGAYTYSFGELQDGEVELVIYESLPDDEYQFYLNGVPMEEPNTPLPWKYDRYDTRAYVPKTMSRKFLGGRPFTAMAKTMQGLSNETIRLLIRKFQQALEPPLAVPKGGKIYSKDIWNAGSVTQGLRKNDFEKLIDHNGVTESEFRVYDLIEKKVEEFIGTPNIAQGLMANQKMSATEVLTATKQFLKQLGYTVAALMRMKRDLTEMRIYTICENYLDPHKRKYDELTHTIQDVYRSFTLLDSRLSNQRTGKKVIKFINRDLTRQEQQDVYNFEEEQATQGNHLSLRFINVDKIKQFPIFWYVVINVTDKEGTALDKLTFQDQLVQAAALRNLTGKQINPDPPTEAFERKWKTKDWFQDNPPPQQSSMPNGEQMMKPDEILNGIDELSKGSGIEGEAKNTTGAQVGRGLRGVENSVQNNILTRQ